MACGCLESARVLDVCEGKGDPFLRDACYMEYGVMANDSSLCASIKSANSKLFCNTIVSGDVSGCEKINATVDSRHACYAYAGRNPAECDKIKVNETRVNCYKTFILMNTDAGNCQKFTDETYKNLCEKKFT